MKTWICSSFSRVVSVSFALGFALTASGSSRALALSDSWTQGPKGRAPGARAPITENMLKFRYQQFDGEINLPCRHVLEDADSQDWSVKCSDGRGNDRRYRVHLWVTRYPRSSEPRVSYEVLYWVTDLSRNPIQGTGTTVWFHLKEDSPLSGVDVSQSVENDTAGLYLQLTVR